MFGCWRTCRIGCLLDSAPLLRNKSTNHCFNWGDGKTPAFHAFTCNESFSESLSALICQFDSSSCNFWLYGIKQCLLCPLNGAWSSCVVNFCIEIDLSKEFYVVVSVFLASKEANGWVDFEVVAWLQHSHLKFVFTLIENAKDFVLPS